MINCVYFQTAALAFDEPSTFFEEPTFFIFEEAKCALHDGSGPVTQVNFRSNFGVQINGKCSYIQSQRYGFKSWLVCYLKFKTKIEFSQLIQVCGTLVSTVTCNGGTLLQVVINSQLNCSFDGIVHQYEENLSRSMQQAQSHCSTVKLKLKKLVLLLFKPDVIILAGSEF